MTFREKTCHYWRFSHLPTRNPHLYCSGSMLERPVFRCHRIGECERVIVILMGVTGTGKTAVGRALAEATGWQFTDADDFHSESNKAKMRSGVPLDDADRAPWLRALHAQIEAWIHAGANAILACSALKESYRATLVAGVEAKLFRFIYLTGPESVIRQRLEARTGHYMPPSMLPSQLATLEPPKDAIEISIVPPVAEIVQNILSELAREGYAIAAGQPKAQGGA